MLAALPAVPGAISTRCLSVSSFIAANPPAGAAAYAFFTSSGIAKVLSSNGWLTSIFMIVADDLLTPFQSRSTCSG